MGVGKGGGALPPIVSKWAPLLSYEVDVLFISVTFHIKPSINLLPAHSQK